MKNLKCDLCEVEANGATFEEWMMDLMPHYMEVHSEEMKKKEGMSKEEMMAEKEKWMKENKARFDEVK